MSWHTHRGLSTRFYVAAPDGKERFIESDTFDGVHRWRLFEGARLVRRGQSGTRPRAKADAHRAALALGWEVLS